MSTDNYEPPAEFYGPDIPGAIAREELHVQHEINDVTLPLIVEYGRERGAVDPDPAWMRERNPGERTR